MVKVMQVGLDSVDFTLVDVNPGHEAAFNHWYENDHFYAGGVLGPSVLAGRRWYASKDLREARFVGEECPFEDPAAGTNLATYFFTIPDGGHEFRTWVEPQLAELRRQGRMFSERVPVNIAFYSFDGVLTGPHTSPVPPHVALDHPFAGLLAVLATGSERPTDAGPPPTDLPRGSLTLAFTWRVEESVVPQTDLSPFVPVTLLMLFLPHPPPTDSQGTAALTRAVAQARGVTPMWGAGFLPIVPGDDAFVTTIR
jgi:hypothetical protein